MNEHLRYFIKRVHHESIFPDSVVYRESTGCWTDNPEKAMFWSDREFAEKKMEELKKFDDQWAKKAGYEPFDFSIGTVHILPLEG